MYLAGDSDMAHKSSLDIAHAWQEVANRQDVKHLLELSHADIEIAGPRGSGHGHDLLRAWLKRADLELRTLRAFVRNSAVVLEQHGVWHSLETGEPWGERTVASYFEVKEEHVTRVARYDHLQEALEKADLSIEDEADLA
jgi:hypothetical protein